MTVSEIFDKNMKLRNVFKMNEMDDAEKIYIAPEILNNEDTSKLIMAEKVDVFALGVLLFISEFKQPPFRQASIRDPLYRYLASKNGA